MSYINVTKEIDLFDHIDREIEVEIEVDWDDIKGEVDADDLVDALTDTESYEDIADRIYNCDSMVDVVAVHREAPALGARIFAERWSDTLHSLREEYPSAVITLRNELLSDTLEPWEKRDQTIANMEALDTDSQKQVLLAIIGPQNITSTAEVLRAFTREIVGPADASVIVRTVEDLYASIDRLTHVEKRGVLNHIIGTIASPQDAITAIIDQNGLDGAVALMKAALMKSISEKLSA